MKKMLLILCIMCMVLLYPTTAQAVDFKKVPTNKCTSYTDISNLQLSGVTNKMLPVVMTLTSDDEKGKDYFFKVTIPKTSMTSLFLRYENELRWNYTVTVYSDATCSNVIYKDDQHDFGRLNCMFLYLEAGDYYIRLHNNYDSEAVLATFPSKTIDKTTTTTSGSSVTTKVPNPALYESSDINIFYNKTGSGKELYTVNNKINIALAYAPVSGMVTYKTKNKNNVCTLTLDASNLLIKDKDDESKLYIQCRQDKTKGQECWDDPDVWDLDSSNWGKSESNTEDVIHVPEDRINKQGQTVAYIKKSGWYSFRIASISPNGRNLAVVKRVFVDVVSPTIKGVKNGKIYTTPKTVKFKDNKGGVGILKATYNGYDFYNGKKFVSDGKYVIRAYDKSKNVKKVTFYIDKNKPVVSGVKKNVTYRKPVVVKFTDKGSGVKSATLNGSSIKSGYKIKKSGNYTLKVTDKIGRTTIIPFKVSL